MTTITNVNVLGFVGSASVSAYADGKGAVSADLALLPYRSKTIVGPTVLRYPSTTAIFYRIDLSAQSDAVVLGHQVCV